MKIENDFVVDVPVQTAWAFLSDLEQVVPCIPGADLEDAVDETAWRGTMKVKLGPMSLLFGGTVRIEEIDEGGRRLVLYGTGQDRRGKGSGTMRATSVLDEVDGRTRVHISQDVAVTGTIAQFGRGVMEDVTTRMLAQFAENLERTLESSATVACSEPIQSPQQPPAAEPVNGVRLILSVLVNRLRRIFSRRRTAA